MNCRLSPLMFGAVLCLGACGDDTTGPSAGEFEPLCGKSEPLRLLALDPAQVPRYVSVRSFGDRYLISIRDASFSVVDAGEHWSVGHCGEDPVLLIDEVDSPVSGGFAPWPELPFVCSDASGRVFALDTTGARPANAVFVTRGCFHQATQAGLITVLGEGPTGPLVLQPWPDDPLAEAAVQIVLVDEARAEVVSEIHTGPSEHEVLRVVGNEVFSVTAAGELVVISLEDPTLEPKPLAEGVREIETSASGRYVLFQGVEVTNENPDWPEGPLFLIDRVAGVTTQIDETALAYTIGTSFLLEPFGLLHYRVGAINDETADRWMQLDTLETYDQIPGLWDARRQLDDDRVLLGHMLSSTKLILDMSSGELTTLWDEAAERVLSLSERLLVQRTDGGELVSVSYDGEQRTLARHVTNRWTLLSGERVVTPFGVDADDVGELVIVDPETLDERYIDHDVLRYTTSVPDRAFGEFTGGDLISYMVSDADPERHGVWLAKPK